MVALQEKDDQVNWRKENFKTKGKQRKKKVNNKNTSTS